MFPNLMVMNQRIRRLPILFGQQRSNAPDRNGNLIGQVVNKRTLQIVTRVEHQTYGALYLRNPGRAISRLRRTPSSSSSYWRVRTGPGWTARRTGVSSFEIRII
ncbi:hypothetical protein TorRG33x02_094810 [Trema orientale]|uniref:Uncharacterized protein n=1 Tax=Trema orientale TaxID=63057 RepID=A0A2P5FA83_TREOI|nr:hypothetical protein TorRG33x02_094810 [Trema orientale]